MLNISLYNKLNMLVCFRILKISSTSTEIVSIRKTLRAHRKNTLNTLIIVVLLIYILEMQLIFLKKLKTKIVASSNRICVYILY